VAKDPGSRNSEQRPELGGSVFGEARQDGVVVKSTKFPRRNFRIKKNTYRERMHTETNIDFGEECIRCIKEEQTVI
jgi:hypothetical protein